MKARARAWRGAVAAVCLAVAAPGCARNLVGEPDPSTVQVADVRARFTPEDRGDFEVDFTAESPFSGACVASEIRWEVWLGERRFAAGALALKEGIPAEGRRAFTVTIPVVFRRASGEPQGPASIEVGVRGQLVLTSAGTDLPVPFRARRSLKVENAPALGGDRAE